MSCVVDFLTAYTIRQVGKNKLTLKVKRNEEEVGKQLKKRRTLLYNILYY